VSDKPTRDGSEPEQMHGYERSELHSLRQHLDTEVVARMKKLEKVATYSRAYLQAAGQASLGKASRADVKAALDMLVIALDQAGYDIHI
jgi:hypothetical protein